MRDVKTTLFGMPVTLTTGLNRICFDAFGEDAVSQSKSDVPICSVIEAAKPLLTQLSEIELAERMLSSITRHGTSGQVSTKYAERIYNETPKEGVSACEFLKQIFDNKYFHLISQRDLAFINDAITILIQKETKASLIKRRRSDFDRKRDQIMLALIERDGYQCQVTGSTEDLTIDHIVPLSKGGSDDIDNLRLVTRSVNSSKGSKPL